MLVDLFWCCFDFLSLISTWPAPPSTHWRHDDFDRGSRWPTWKSTRFRIISTVPIEYDYYLCQLDADSQWNGYGACLFLSPTFGIPCIPLGTRHHPNTDDWNSLAPFRPDDKDWIWDGDLSSSSTDEHHAASSPSFTHPVPRGHQHTCCL